MAGSERTLVLKLVADVDKAARGIDGINSKLGGLGKAVGALAVVAVVKEAAGALIDFGKGAVEAASSIEESNARIDTVLGISGQRVKDFAETSADAYGISKAAALDYGGQFATLFTALGQSDTVAAESSAAFLGLAADMASFNNVPIGDALTALQAGLRGESEPLRKFGVLLDDAALRAQAMEMGLVKSTKDALTPQTKALAAQALILEETALQQGDVERTSDGLANSQKKLEAKLSDVTAEIGAELLPIITTLVRWAVANLLPFIKKAWEAFQKVAAVVGPVLVPVVETLFDAFGDLWDALQPLVKELLPVLLALFRFLAPIIKIVGQAFAGAVRGIAAVVRIITTLVRWVKDAVKWVENLLAKIPKIEIPNISLPFSATATSSTARAAGRAGTTAAASAGARTVNVNVYGGDPAAVQAAVLRALRGYSRTNGAAQVLPSW